MAASGHVAPRYRQRIGRGVHRHDPGSGALGGDRKPDRPGAATEIGYGWAGVRGHQRKRALDDPLRFRPWNQRCFAHNER